MPVKGRHTCHTNTCQTLRGKCTEIYQFTIYQLGKYPIYILDIYRNYNCGGLINVIVRFVTIPS